MGSEIAASPARRRTPRPASWPAAIAATAAALVIVGVAGWFLHSRFDHVMGARAFWYAVGFALVPVVPLTAVFVWLNRLRPEPAAALVVALLWGALVAAAGALRLNEWLAAEIGDVHGATARSAVFVAPWVEEVMKGAVVFALIYWRRHRFNAVVAGVVLGGLAGVGFAFTENILYYGQHFQAQGSDFFSFGSFEGLFVWRGVKSPFVHPMFTMMTGAGVGMAVRYRHSGVRILAPVAGFCLAVLLHMGYNAIASFSQTEEELGALYVAVLLPTLLSLVAVIAVVRRHERGVIAARLMDYTEFGWLKRDHVPYIVGATARRRARRYAKQFGTVERARVKRFQATGVELGSLRDCLVRGVVGQSELTRERDLIDEIRSLRSRVLLPGVTAGGQAAPWSTESSW